MKFLLAMSLVLAGCATVKPLDRDAYIAATTRSYAGPAEKVVRNAQAVLELVDVWAFKFAHAEDGFTAYRTQPNEVWEFKTRVVDGQVKASLQVRTADSTFPIAPTNKPGTVAFTGGSLGPSEIVPGDALYALFWARMDYMQFKRDTWATCDDAKESVYRGITSGPIDPMCSLWSHDDVPGQLRKPQYKPQGNTMARPQDTVPGPGRTR